LQVDATDTSSFGASLVECLLQDSPGMNCSLATQLLSPDYVMLGDRMCYAISHYLGVLSYSEPQSPYNKKTVHRWG